ncbi:MAG: cellulase family glycosylhydrolase [Calditrichaceae bacterium]|nr:cellulase family glycosylhydrolase [Calditrichaceae bacterium]
MKKLLPVIGFVTIFIQLCFTQSSQFVTVKDKQFHINGQPYYFLGSNIWFGANMGMAGEQGDRDRLTKELDYLKLLGINNLRVMGASEGKQFNTVRPSIQPELGIFEESILQGLDFLLAEMGKRNMYAVVFLNNYWVWSGGMSQYVAWEKNIEVPNPFLPPYDWHHFMNFSSQFYYSKKMNDAFKKYIEKIVKRTNTITGKKYKDDPAIMAWQLANEPRPGSGAEGKQHFTAFSKWIDETSNYIKSIDNNHLVSTGNEGLAGCLESEEVFKEIHQYEGIDYMTFHLWILNWRWFLPHKADSTYPIAEKKAAQYIKDHIDFANEAGKPIVIEEFGIPRDLHSYNPASATVYRDKYYDMIFRMIYENSKNGGPLVGSNFWAWGGFGKVREPKEAVWKEGDDYTGDPPQEPQGRNSVFVTDSSTIEILSRYCELMNGLK